MVVSCRLRHHFKYTQKCAGEEKKGPPPNNMRESAFQRTNREILNSADFYIV